MITLASSLKNGINDDVFNKNVRITRRTGTFPRETGESPALAPQAPPREARGPARAPRQHRVLLPALGDRPEPPAAGPRAPPPFRADPRPGDDGDGGRRRPGHPAEPRGGTARPPVPVPRLHPARRGEPALA